MNETLRGPQGGSLEPPPVIRLSRHVGALHEPRWPGLVSSSVPDSLGKVVRSSPELGLLDHPQPQMRRGVQQLMVSVLARGGLSSR